MVAQKERKVTSMNMLGQIPFSIPYHSINMNIWRPLLRMRVCHMEKWEFDSWVSSKLELETLFCRGPSPLALQTTMMVRPAVPVGLPF